VRTRCGRDFRHELNNRRLLYAQRRSRACADAGGEADEGDTARIGVEQQRKQALAPLGDGCRAAAQYVVVIEPELEISASLCHCDNAVCSLQPEEGPARIAALLARGAPVARVPIEPQEIGGLAELLTPEGELRSLPCHLAEQGGMDGFYACRLRRT